MNWTLLSQLIGDAGHKIEMTHPSGSVFLDDPAVRLRDGGTQIRAIVQADVWRRIRESDIFGAASRQQQRGPLNEEQPLRITVFIEQELGLDGTTFSSEEFVIIDAMQQIDPKEIETAGLQGEIWEGVGFVDPQPWSLAIEELAAEGFEPFDGLPSATTVRREADELSVEFRHHEIPQVVHAQVVLALPEGNQPTPGTYELVNIINAGIPFGTAMVDAGDLILRECIPDQLADAGPAVIAERVITLLKMMGAIRDSVLQVAAGDMDVAEARTIIFG